jgi:hypothetical protein
MITIRSHDQTVKPMTLVVSDRQQLASLLEECKRFKDIAGIFFSMLYRHHFLIILRYEGRFQDDPRIKLYMDFTLYFPWICVL